MSGHSSQKAEIKVFIKNQTKSNQNNKSKTDSNSGYLSHMIYM